MRSWFFCFRLFKGERNRSRRHARPAAARLSQLVLLPLQRRQRLRFTGRRSQKHHLFDRRVCVFLQGRGWVLFFLTVSLAHGIWWGLLRRDGGWNGHLWVQSGSSYIHRVVYFSNGTKWNPADIWTGDFQWKEENNEVVYNVRRGGEWWFTTRLDQTVTFNVLTMMLKKVLLHEALWSYFNESFGFTVLQSFWHTVYSSNCFSVNATFHSLLSLV